MQLSFPSLPRTQAGASPGTSPTAPGASAGNTDGFASLLAGVAGDDTGPLAEPGESPAGNALPGTPCDSREMPESGNSPTRPDTGATTAVAPVSGPMPFVLGGSGLSLPVTIGTPVGDLNRAETDADSGAPAVLDSKPGATRRSLAEEGDAQALMTVQMPPAAPLAPAAPAPEADGDESLERPATTENAGASAAFSAGTTMSGGMTRTAGPLPLRISGAPATATAGLFQRGSASTIDAPFAIRSQPWADASSGAPSNAHGATPTSASPLGSVVAGSPLPAFPTTFASAAPVISPVTPGVDQATLATDDGRTATPPPAGAGPTATNSQPAMGQETARPAPSTTPAAVTLGAGAEAAGVSGGKGEAPAPRVSETRRPAGTRVAATSTGELARAAEKFAAATGEGVISPRASGPGGMKSALTPSPKDVTGEKPELGIDAADTSVTMPAGSSLDHSTSSDSVAVHAAAGLAEAKGDQGMLPPTVSLPSTAHRAVEAVLDATERFAARDQHSVNLQFTVGGSDLRVRVELRGGEVHTTFRTDSAELRAALSSEWQSVTQSPGDRPTRLAAPVFTSSDANAGSNFEQGAQRHRQPEGDARSQTFTPATAARPAQPATFAVNATPSRRPAAANSVHLHTLA